MFAAGIVLAPTGGVVVLDESASSTSNGVVSKAPRSHRGGTLRPLGRGRLRWSTVSAAPRKPLVPTTLHSVTLTSRPTLPPAGAIVCVGPPLLASAPSVIGPGEVAVRGGVPARTQSVALPTKFSPINLGPFEQSDPVFARGTAVLVSTEPVTTSEPL